MRDRESVLLVQPASGIESLSRYRVPMPKYSFDLWLAGNEGPAPPEVPVIDSHSVRRYPSAEAFEARIADRFSASPESVLVTAGADDALARAIRVVGENGREIVVPIPTFEMIDRYIKLSGAAMIGVDWSPGTPWPVGAVLEVSGNRTAAIVMISPNNPTGSVATSDDLRAVADAFPSTLVIVDQAYVDYGGEDLWVAARELSNVIVLRTLSKAWGAAGLRVGFALGDARVISWMRRIGQPYAVSGPSLAIAASLLECDESWRKTHVEGVRREREELIGILGSVGLRAFPSEANFVLARCRDAERIVDGLARRGIAVRRFEPVEGEGASLLQECVRVTCPGNEADFRRLVHALREISEEETP